MTPDLLVSGGIVAALEQAAVAVGRRSMVAAHLHGLPLWVGANLSLGANRAASQNRFSQLSPAAANRARRALVARTVARPGIARPTLFPSPAGV